MIEVEYLNDLHPILVLDDDVKVEIYRSSEDNEIVVQISTSPDTDSWENLRVYLNDGRATRWE
jgi:hypothetical protein